MQEVEDKSMDVDLFDISDHKEYIEFMEKSLENQETLKQEFMVKRSLDLFAAFIEGAVKVLKKNVVDEKAQRIGSKRELRSDLIDQFNKELKRLDR